MRPFCPNSYSTGTLFSCGFYSTMVLFSCARWSTVVLFFCGPGCKKRSPIPVWCVHLYSVHVVLMLMFLIVWSLALLVLLKCEFHFPINSNLNLANHTNWEFFNGQTFPSIGCFNVLTLNTQWFLMVFKRGQFNLPPPHPDPFLVLELLFPACLQCHLTVLSCFPSRYFFSLMFPLISLLCY